MTVIDLIFLVVWAAFWIYWLAAAVNVKGSRSGSRGSAAMGVRVAVALVVVVLLRTHAITGNSASANGPLLQGLGLGLFGLGLAEAIWSRLYIGRNWGTPMSEKADPELVTTGPYRYIRHPIYSGLILAMIGTALALGVYWLIPLVLLGGYFVFSAVVEERTMIRLFPATYPAYKRSTRMLIPFVL